MSSVRSGFRNPKTTSHHSTSGCLTTPQGTTQLQTSERVPWSDARSRQSGDSTSLAITRTCITRSAWARSAPTAASREELLPWFVGAAIPAALVTGPARTGGPTATTSRKHLLSRSVIGNQSNRRKNACQDKRNTAHNSQGRHSSRLAAKEGVLIS